MDIQFYNIPWGCSSVGRAPALQAGGHEFESHHLHVSHEFDVMNCFSEPIANVFANRVREAIHRSSNDDREREMPRISSATENVAECDDRKRETEGFERHGKRIDFIVP